MPNIEFIQIKSYALDYRDSHDLFFSEFDMLNRKCFPKNDNSFSSSIFTTTDVDISSARLLLVEDDQDNHCRQM